MLKLLVHFSAVILFSMKDEELDKTIEEWDIPDAHPAVHDMLREVALGAQGHAGASQNFEAFSDIDEELDADKKIRFEIDRRSLIAGIVLHLY